MARAEATVISRVLPWLVLQAALLPAFLGPSVWTDAGRSPGLTILTLLLAAWVAFCIVANLRRLATAPVRESFRTHVVLLLGGALLLAFLSAGRLLEGSGGDRLVAAPVALVALALVALAVREVRRLRSVGRVGLEPTTQGL